jgi:hypothetical protein
MASILRLFYLETDTGARFSSLIDTSLPNADNSGYITTDPWRIVMAVASKSKEGLSRALQWLCLFARSGVDVPISTYMKFSSLAVRFDVSLDDGLLLVAAALSSTWLRSMGRQQLQSLFSALHVQLAPQIIHRLQTKTGLSDA